MLALSLSTSLPPATTPGAGPSPAPSDAFGTALADALTPSPAPPGAAVTPDDERQDDADGGKSLPAKPDDATDSDRIDPAFAWMGTSAPTPVPMPPVDTDTPPVGAAGRAPGPQAVIAGSDPARLEVSHAKVMPGQFKTTHAPAVPHLVSPAVTGAPSVAVSKPALRASVALPSPTALPAIDIASIAAAPIAPSETPAPTDRGTKSPTISVAASSPLPASPSVAMPEEASVPTSPAATDQPPGASAPRADRTMTATALPTPQSPAAPTPPTAIASPGDASPIIAGAVPATADSQPLAAPLTTVAFIAAPVASPPHVGVAPSTVSAAPSTPAAPVAAPDGPTTVQPTPAQQPADTVATPAIALAAAPPPPPSAPQPAAIVFGQAIASIFADERRPKPQDDIDSTAPTAGLSALGLATAPMPAVAALAGMQQSSLDMRRDDWPQAMVDRIEALRDAADANDTRIRLVPDALGKVDVSLRHDGDTIHVQFNAEVPATRTLIAEAQPKLAEIAQARGIRLSQTSVDAGDARGNQRQNGAPPHSPNSTRPASALVADAEPADSVRLA